MNASDVIGHLKLPVEVIPLSKQNPIRRQESTFFDLLADKKDLRWNCFRRWSMPVCLIGSPYWLSHFDLFSSISACGTITGRAKEMGKFWILQGHRWYTLVGCSWKQISNTLTQSTTRIMVYFCVCLCTNCEQRHWERQSDPALELNSANQRIHNFHPTPPFTHTHSTGMWR